MKDNDPLDQWLDQLPRLECPAWFEAKTLARIRREQPSRSRWPFFKWAIPMGTVGAVVLMLTLSSPKETSAPVAHSEELALAVETFALYLEEQEQWPVELAGSSPAFW